MATGPIYSEAKSIQKSPRKSLRLFPQVVVLLVEIFPIALILGFFVLEVQVSRRSDALPEKFVLILLVLIEFALLFLWAYLREHLLHKVQK